MRSVKHGRKRSRRSVNYNKNLAVAKKKALKRRKSLNGMTCKQMCAAWDKNATVRQNMKSMGLAYDSNKLFPLRRAISKNCEEMEVGKVKLRGTIESQCTKSREIKKNINKTKVTQVIAALEKEVKEEEEKQKKGRRYRLLARDIEFCLYMIERHGNDYEEMSRDAKNIYQDTSKQIQRKIRIFKQSPEYSKYLELVSEIA
uniref:Nucleolar protein 16 n=1 Tax=Setaria digitata TaxID=48799 RepID=A0A915Q7C0_9BILA